MTSRAWLVASAHKRRTLSRADIAKAIAKSDTFDFLIDIVPREMANEKGRGGVVGAGGKAKVEGAEEEGLDQDHDLHEDDVDEGDLDGGEGDDQEGVD